MRGDEFAGSAGSSGLLVVWAWLFCWMRSETECEGSLHDLPNSLVVVGPANALGDMGIADACGEYDFDGHVVEFENLQLAALAELGYLRCLNSKISFICHSFMHEHSLAHVFDGVGGGVGEMASGEAVGSLLRGCGTARLDGLMHDVIRPTPACGHSRIQGLPEYYDCSYAQQRTSSNSRPERGPEPQEKQSGRGGVLCARSGRMLGKSWLFLSNCHRKVHVETWAGGCQSLNLRISQEQEIGRRCAVVGFPPRNPCVTPVLPGPGSDTRMKMGWKSLTKTENSGVCFSRMPRVCEGGGTPVAYGGCGRSGRGLTALRGRSLVVPRAPVHIRMGGAQLSGRILESGAGHCWPECGGLSHP